MLCFFRFRSSFCGILSADLNPLFISVVGYLLRWRVVCSSSKVSFSEIFIRDYGAYSTY